MAAARAKAMKVKKATPKGNVRRLGAQQQAAKTRRTRTAMKVMKTVIKKKKKNYSTTLIQSAITEALRLKQKVFYAQEARSRKKSTFKKIDIRLAGWPGSISSEEELRKFYVELFMRMEIIMKDMRGMMARKFFGERGDNFLE